MITLYVDRCINWLKWPVALGCIDSLALNYDSLANTNSGCIYPVYGCTDPNAFNYDPLANTEDFSCVDVVLGCTDPSALNYNPEANTEDFSCIDILEGCMDPLAYNYDPVVNVDNGGCLYDAGCIGGPGNPYWLNDSCYAWVIVVDPSCCNLEWDEKCQSLYDYCSEEFSIGLDDLRDDEILIYPNPTTDIINITAKNDIKIDVINLLGEVIITIENQDQIREIVKKVDRIPLAICLVAAQLNKLPLELIYSRMMRGDDTAGMETYSHQKMEKALLWSFSLLHPHQYTVRVQRVI